MQVSGSIGAFGVAAVGGSVQRGMTEGRCLQQHDLVTATGRAMDNAPRYCAGQGVTGGEEGRAARVGNSRSVQSGRRADTCDPVGCTIQLAVKLAMSNCENTVLSSLDRKSVV